MFGLVLFLIMGTAFCDPEFVCVISDTHIGDSQHTSEKSFSAVLSFLDYILSEKNKCHTLVLNGDIVDMWTIDYSVDPELPRDILQSTDYNGFDVSKFTEKLKEIIQKEIRIVYVGGNHDDFVNQEELDEAGLGKVEWVKVLQEFNYEIHHGHEWTINNLIRPSGEEEGITKPWSYYAVRSKITHFLNDNDKCAPSTPSSSSFDFKVEIHQRICELLSSPDSTLDLSIFSDSKFMKKFDVDWQIGGGDPFTLSAYHKMKDIPIKGGHWTSYNDRDATLEEAVQIYRNDIEKWIEEKGEDYVRKMLLADPCGDFSYFVEEESNKSIFITGHFHKEELKKIENTESTAQIHANTGCWCSTSRNGIEEEEKTRFPVIVLYQPEKEKNPEKVQLHYFYPFKDERDLTNIDSMFSL